MSRIIFQKSYLILLPSYQMTHTHKHPFLHLFFSKKGCRICFDDTTLKGNIILLDSNVPHMTKEENGFHIVSNRLQHQPFSLKVDCHTYSRQTRRFL